MATLASGGGTGELERFRRLVTFTIAATFALIVIGGVVRVSDSGLGCGPAGSGTEGWPLCGGGILPFLETNAIVEFTHRVVAAGVGVLIVVLAWQALRRLRDHPWLVRGSVAAAVLVLAQAGLGGLTVEHNLHEILVAAHLGLAMLLLAVLIALRRGTYTGGSAPLAAGRRPAAPPSAAPAGANGALRPLAAVAVTLLFATIVAGGYMAGTEREGAEGGAVRGGAHLACGTEFPTCQGELAPFGTGEMVDVHLTHRALMYTAALALLALVVVARRRGIRSPALPLAAGLLVLQILLGALNVWIGEHAELVVAHLTVGTLLWGTTVYAAFELVSIPEPARARLAPTDTKASTMPA